MYYSIAHTIVRDDGEYLDEWIDYHSSLGFEHFVIYDNESDTPIVNKWGDKVTVNRVVCKAVDLPRLFNRTLKTHKAVWLATFDIDEFIVLHKDRHISELLENYKDYGGLAINWLVYGSSGHIKKPEGFVRDNYLWRTPPEYPCNVHVKTISQMEYCKDIFNVHTCLSTKPLVNEDYVIAHGLSESSRTLCRINHYIIKSLEDYERKVRLAQKVGAGDSWNMNGFYDVDRNSTVYDDILKTK
jgi:hypothetical protein